MALRAASCPALNYPQMMLSRRQILRSLGYQSQKRLNSSKRSQIKELLREPSWSIRSLLPDAEAHAVEEVNSDQLHHLLRLSALPKPKTPEEETKMLEVLRSQLYFVRDVQNVDTTGVKALQSIRDETEQGINEATIGLDWLMTTLMEENLTGRNKRPRRVKSETAHGPFEDSKAVEMSQKTVRTAGGDFFVVNSQKDTR